MKSLVLVQQFCILVNNDIHCLSLEGCDLLVTVASGRGQLKENMLRGSITKFYTPVADWIPNLFLDPRLNGPVYITTPVCVDKYGCCGGTNSLAGKGAESWYGRAMPEKATVSDVYYEYSFGVLDRGAWPLSDSFCCGIRTLGDFRRIWWESASLHQPSCKYPRSTHWVYMPNVDI